MSSVGAPSGGNASFGAKTGTSSGRFGGGTTGLGAQTPASGLFGNTNTTSASTGGLFGGSSTGFGGTNQNTTGFSKCNLSPVSITIVKMAPKFYIFDN